MGNDCWCCEVNVCILFEHSFRSSCFMYLHDTLQISLLLCRPISSGGSTCRPPFTASLCTRVCLYLVTDVLCSSLLPFLRSMCVRSRKRNQPPVDRGPKHRNARLVSTCRRTKIKYRSFSHLIKLGHCDTVETVESGNHNVESGKGTVIYGFRK